MLSKKKIGLLPGTFDPITKGHTDILIRATKFLDHLIIGVAEDIVKEPLFSSTERFDMTLREVESLKSCMDPLCHVEVKLFSGLLIGFAKTVQATVILRGLRAVSDFEYEFQMAGMNSYLSSEIETTFLMASDRYQFISSRFVKEIARLGGDISHFVSPYIKDALSQKFGSK